MSVRFCTLFSGSSANSAFIEHTDEQGNKKAILIDAGAGVKCMEKALSAIGASFDEIGAIFITHEHSDHIKGLKSILRKYRIRVVSNVETVAAIQSACPEIDENFFIPLQPNARIRNDVFEIIPFDSSHDSVHCCGYTVSVGNVKLGCLTDCGSCSEKMIDCLSGCKAVIIESNHDIAMLENGPYPIYLKRRVSSEHGHMSNVQCGRVLCELAKKGLEAAILAHLSKENNTPSVALNTVREILSSRGIREGEEINIYVAPPSGESKILEF